MAKTSVSINFGRFKYSRPGYAALMREGAVQADLRRRAKAVQQAADSMLSEGGYNRSGHEVGQINGVLAPGASVYTRTKQAQYTQAKRKSLTKALNAARG